MPILTPIIIEQFGYAIPTSMIVRFEEKEIAELIDDTGLVTAQILEKYLNTGDTTGLSNLEIDALKEGVKVLCKACHDADSLVSVHLANAGIQTPMQSKIPAIENAACDIARYYLYDIQAPEIVIERYRDAVDLLKQISNKKLNLGIEVPIISGFGVNITSETPRFTL